MEFPTMHPETSLALSVVVSTKSLWMLSLFTDEEMRPRARWRLDQGYTALKTVSRMQTQIQAGSAHPCPRFCPTVGPG